MGKGNLFLFFLSFFFLGCLGDSLGYFPLKKIKFKKRGKKKKAENNY